MKSQIIAALSFQVSKFTYVDFTEMILNPQNPKVSPQVRQYIIENPDWSKRSEEIIKEFTDGGLSILTPDSKYYPEGFHKMMAPPVFVSYLGAVEKIQHPSIAVVGSRTPSSKGQDFLIQTLTDFLKSTPIPVISGAARGIDQLAHKCALRNNCPTVAILPSGIRNPYPTYFDKWISEIIDSGGCVMSEYLPNSFMQKHYFYRRNQLIVGLSTLLFVIEAKRKSGSIMTARHALDNSRDIAVAPGHPFDPQYGGSLDLLYDGGVLIRDHLDLMMCFNRAFTETRIGFSFEKTTHQ